MSIKNNIISGGASLGLANVIIQVFAVVTNVILAKLLLPEHFGIVALSTSSIGFIRNLTNIGFGSSIIYFGSANEKQLSSLFWLGCFLSVFKYTCIYIFSESIGKFYNEPMITEIMRISSISLLVTPLFNVQYKIMQRELNFKEMSKIEFASSILGGMSAIFAAFYGFGIYSLIIQSILSTLIKFFIIILKRIWFPKILYDFSSIKDMVWYSLKFKISNMLYYFERNIDYLILGKFLSSELGYYAFAYNIMYMH